MSAPVSVIVVSRGRPALLTRCLTGISQLCYPDFEIVVVADQSGCDAMRESGWETRVKIVPFDAPNISAARNAGIAASAGEVVAFIDDDAVPEPTWLNHLIAPFNDPGVSATGGYVIGRNGISLQWAGRAVNAYGEHIALDHAGDDPFEPAPPDGYATRTEGTNCAFRRANIAKMGGFDPVFRFYLDETDVNVRLGVAGERTVLVPLARVHHGYAPSPRRRADRAPRNLTEIGASTAAFLRKHAGDGDPAIAFGALRDHQKRGLLSHMVDGRIEPRDVSRLLKGFEAGFTEGLARDISPLAPIPPSHMPFLRFAAPARQARHLAGRIWSLKRLRARAAKAISAGDNVTVFRFSPTALPHRVRFHAGGWWEHHGGLFGRAARDEPVFKVHSFRNRLRKEWASAVKLRQCPERATRASRSDGPDGAGS